MLFHLLLMVWSASSAHAFGGPKPAPMPPSMPEFKRVFIVILENTDSDEALRQPFMARLARDGAHLSNFDAITHPSQPNYIALTAASTHGVTGNKNVDLNVRHIGDLVEAKGKTWKTYAEGYPGDCFLGSSYGRYVRKHNPMMSFTNVTRNPARCAQIVNASVLRDDIERGTLPNFMLYIPDNDNNGHDTGAEYADRWLAANMGPLLKDPRFIDDTLFILTFDESDSLFSNEILTIFYGKGILPGSEAKAKYNLYDLLRTIEDAWGLGTLGIEDSRAKFITGVWK